MPRFAGDRPLRARPARFNSKKQPPISPGRPKFARAVPRLAAAPNLVILLHFGPPDKP
jgi:hypothetical protein